ncbi:MAG: right-handed parallel beta-helix repeat-containing protein [Cyanobacteria bacterium P01_A01_bin.83]
MERRIFLTWMGLALLASASPIVISACISQNQDQLASDSPSKSLEPVLFYVAPSGNDNWSGRLEKHNADKTNGPFATLERAKDAVRELKHLQGGTLKQPVTVLVRDGIYFLSKPLVFTPEDSGKAGLPITYKAYPQEKPLISGGRLIENWQQQGNLWVADLPEVRTGKWYFRLLRVGEDWAIRARYPNLDSNNPLTGGWLFNIEPISDEQTAFNQGVGGIHNVGDRLEWSIDVPTTANYRVWVRYAHNMKAYGINTLDERTAIHTDKSDLVPLRNMPDTGSFSSYRWALSATINLSSGKQTLVWENVRGGGLALDAFCLTDDPDWNPTTAIRISKGGSEYQVQSPKEGKNFLLIQAETFVKVVGSEVTVSLQPSGSKDIPIATAQFPNWQNWDEGTEVNIFPAEDWVNAILPVTNVDRQSQKLYCNCSEKIRPGNRFFITNIREALDHPREWYLDKNTGELLYWAETPEFPDDVPVIAPVMDRLFVLQGDMENQSFVEHIHFQDFTFADTDYNLAKNYYFPADAAIWLSAARSCEIRDCNFVKLGGYAIKIEQRSHENYIVGNSMTRLGQGGVVLLGNTVSQAFNNLIAANDIQDCGQVYKHVAGVYVTTGSGNRIVHNRIVRMPRYGIALNSYDPKNYSHNNLVEFNEIVDTNLETSDTGAIATLGRDKQISNNIIRFNSIRNVVGMGTKASGQIISPTYTWGIYLDDYSSGTKIYGNIVVGTVLGAVNIHGGKDNQIENNIFVDGAEKQIQLSPKDEFMMGNTIQRNIFVYGDMDAKLWSGNGQIEMSKLVVKCDYNLYWHTAGLDLAQTGKAITPKGNFTQWQAAGFDRNSFISDPLFESFEKNNFRLNTNSPAFSLGFQPIPIERIGIENFNLREYENV